MDGFRLPDAVRRPRHWSLSARLTAALALAMLPLLILLLFMVIDDWRLVDAIITPARLFAMALPLLLWMLAMYLTTIVARTMLVEPLQQIRAMVENPDAPVSLSDLGSAEMQVLADSIVTMREAVTTHSNELVLALIEQQRLTREMHHRVKNSLQIVSSVLALHGREGQSAEVAQSYAAMQARVGALALVHRWIFDGETLSSVDLQALGAELAKGLEISLVSPTHPEVRIISDDLEPLTTSADAAIPVAFLITEASSIAVTTAPDGPLLLRLGARRDGDKVLLTIAAETLVNRNPLESHKETASVRIIRGMARQLQAPISHVGDAGVLEICFVDSGRLASLRSQ
ncbi:MAG: hypothetical protein CFE37_07515 [Alphaproteobacteria bacterium PA4]|nr:MAG: hypothetical protein CFE37_07515 [Alphaproteobacteria bacterium PA4]